MRRRLPCVVVLLAAVAGFAGVGWAQNQESAPPTALVRVALPSGEALARFRAFKLPIYARPGGYLLVGADEAGLDDLTESGLSFRVLDPDISDVLDGRTGDRLYFAFTMPGRSAPDWSAYGRVLIAGPDQVLLRASAADAARLALEGGQVRQVRFDSKPPPAATVGSFSSALAADPYIQLMMDLVDTSVLTYHVGDLSGAWPALIGGESYTIPTRYTYSGIPIQKATRYVGEYFQNLGLNVEYHEWHDSSNPNVIGELPGMVNPNEIFIICAHLDDKRESPGADDNGSGSTAVMMAADILSRYGWDYTLRFALWTGEEQNLDGSHAYAKRAYGRGENIVGVLNLDMIAWNTPLSRPDIDLIGNRGIPGSMELADLFAEVVSVYGLDLIPEVTSSDVPNSDHYSFWEYGYSAIVSSEDDADFNPYYHSPNDLLSHLDQDYFTELVKAAVGTFAHMGEAYTAELGALTVTIFPQLAVAAGAQWRLDGGDWNGSGETLSNLTVGGHTLEFKQTDRWIKPFDSTVTIASGQTTEATGIYRPFRRIPPFMLMLD